MDVQKNSGSESSRIVGQGRQLRGRAGQTGMSYKFQRLREKIRAAITSGELTGKLPGERALAKRFHVNAKTLSKALTDLAAEGVLDRSIGRGTYVKGCAPAAPTLGRWLVIADAGNEHSALVGALKTENPVLNIVNGVDDLRPSYLNQFSAVIDMAEQTPEAFLRDLVVRNIPVVAVHREPKTYSMHSVLIDAALGAARLGRDLMLAGHRRFAAIEPRGCTQMSAALRHSLSRYAPDGLVDACTPEEIDMLIDNGVTAVVCGSCEAATEVESRLERAQSRIPLQVSLAAVGCMGDSTRAADTFVQRLKSPTRLSDCCATP